MGCIIKGCDTGAASTPQARPSHAYSTANQDMARLFVECRTKPIGIMHISSPGVSDRLYGSINQGKSCSKPRGGHMDKARITQQTREYRTRRQADRYRIPLIIIFQQEYVPGPAYLLTHPLARSSSFLYKRGCFYRGG